MFVIAVALFGAVQAFTVITHKPIASACEGPNC
jgi:hypothetical protein